MDRRELWSYLYEQNKNVDRDTYNARKYKAQCQVQANARSDAIAGAFRSIGSVTDNYSWNRLGNTYDVEFDDSQMAIWTVEWYDIHSYDMIQESRQNEEYAERQRQKHEELMRTSPEYREEHERKEREEREQRQREVAKRQKMLETRLANNALKMGFWMVFAILLGGVICGLLFLYAGRSVDGGVVGLGFGVVGAIVCLIYAIRHESGCVGGCVGVVCGYFVYGVLVALCLTMLPEQLSKVFADGVVKAILLAIGGIIGALHGMLLVNAIKRGRVEKITKEFKDVPIPTSEYRPTGNAKKKGIWIFFIVLAVIVVVVPLAVGYISELNNGSKQNQQNTEQSESDDEDYFGYFTDSRDGQEYRTIEIGDITWLERNLNYQPRSGGSWCYNNVSSNCNKYGRLYDWNTATTVCPTGWHLPTRQEWKYLVTVTGGDAAGTMLKKEAGWVDDGNGTNDYLFSALPGGSRATDGSFKNLGNRGLWWTATEYDADSAYYRRMGYNYEYAYEGNYDKGHGFSVRCVQ